MAGDCSAAVRSASSATSAWCSTQNFSSADTPCRRKAAWAARPGTVSRKVIAPAVAVTISSRWAR